MNPFLLFLWLLLETISVYTICFNDTTKLRTNKRDPKRNKSQELPHSVHYFERIVQRRASFLHFEEVWDLECVQ